MFIDFGSMVVRVEDISYAALQDKTISMGVRHNPRCVDVSFPTVEDARAAYRLILAKIQ